MIAKNLTSNSISSLATAPISVICANGQSSANSTPNNWAYNYMPYNVHTSGSTNTGTYSYTSQIERLAVRIAAIEDRLCIICPDFEKHEKFSSLKKAYEHYKLIEKMCTGT